MTGARTRPAGWLAAALALAGVAASAPAPAAAQVASSERRIAVLRFEGAGELEVRRSVMKAAAAQGVALIGAREMDVAAAARGKGSRIEGSSGLGPVAGDLRVVGLVDGHVIVKPRGASARIAVRSARDGGLVAAETFTVRGGNIKLLARHVEENFWRQLGPAVEKAITGSPSPVAGRSAGPTRLASPPRMAPPPRGSVAVSRTATTRSEAGGAPRAGTVAPALAAARASELTDPTTADATVERPGTGPAATPATAAERPADPGASRGAAPLPALLDLAIGPRFFSRRLSYNVDPRGSLREFQTRSWTPSMGVQVAFFPLSRRRALPAHPGVVVDLERGLSLESRTAMNRIYQSPAGDYRASIVVRLPHRLATPEATMGAGWHGFAFEPQGAARTEPAPLPDVGYTYLRLGLGARVHTSSPLTVVFGAHYRHVLDAGGVASPEWFSRLSVHGLEANAGFAYRFFPRWEARAEVNVRRYAYDLNSQPGDAREGDEATDIYWSFGFGVAMLFGTAPAGGTTP